MRICIIHSHSIRRGWKEKWWTICSRENISLFISRKSQFHIVRLNSILLFHDACSFVWRNLLISYYMQHSLWALNLFTPGLIDLSLTEQNKTKKCIFHSLRLDTLLAVDFIRCHVKRLRSNFPVNKMLYASIIPLGVLINFQSHLFASFLDQFYKFHPRRWIHAILKTRMVVKDLQFCCDTKLSIEKFNASLLVCLQKYAYFVEIIGVFANAWSNELRGHCEFVKFSLPSVLIDRRQTVRFRQMEHVVNLNSPIECRPLQFARLPKNSREFCQS